jgi:hypothetical protein
MTEFPGRRVRKCVHAARRYSWRRPPSRSCRRTAPCPFSVTVITSASGSGGSSSSARCGRCWLQGRPGARCSPSPSPFPRTALRTRVPVILAPGSPRGPSPTNGCVAARLRSTRAGLPGRSPVFTGSCCPTDPPPQPRCALRHVHAARVLGLLRALRHDPPQQPTTHLPTTQRWGGQRPGRCPRSPPPGRRGRCPALPGSLARGTPQAFPLASPTGHYLPAAESLAAIATGVHC